MPLQTDIPNDSRTNNSVAVEAIRKIVAGISSVPLDTIRDDQTLSGDLSWDSLDLVECAMELEEEFDISVPEDTMDEVHTVGDVIEGVLQLLGARNASTQ